jgi:hypothetical protein
MSRWGSLALLAVAMLAACTHRSAAAPADLALRHVSVVDVRSGAVRADQTVLVRGSAIVEVGDAGRLAATPAAREVDGRGKFLIPGLWDMHIHLLDRSRWSWGSLLAVANGITGVRDPATTRPLDEVRRLRGQLRSEEIVAPDFVTAGPLIDGPPPIFTEFVTVATPEEMRVIVDSLATQGVDFIKSYSRLSRDSFLAAIGTARTRGLSVDGHVPLAITTAEASDAGMRSVEHAYRHRLACAAAEARLRSLLLEQVEAQQARNQARVEALEHETWRLGQNTYSTERCRALGRRFRRNGTWFVPTLVEMYSRYRSDGFDRDRIATLFADPRLRLFPPDRVARWRSNLEEQADWLRVQPNRDELIRLAEREVHDRLRMVRDMHRGGAMILAGTDASFNFPLVLLGYSLHEELEMLVQAGLSPLEALQAATIAPARFLGRSDRDGEVRPGHGANLVLLEASPLEDIRNSRRIVAVVLRGRLLDRTRLDELLEEAARLSHRPPE